MAYPGYGTQQLANQMGSMCLHAGQGPARAGDSAVLGMFAHGNVVILTSNASGKSLRINEAGNVEGLGGSLELAQFRVHVRRPGVVALQNIYRPEKWLAIQQGRTVGTGQGGPYCEFAVSEIEGRFVCFESTMHPGQYVGILPDGCAKPPGNTKTGPHGRFTVTIHSFAQPVFSQGNIVIFQSCASGKSLRITGDGLVQGLGERGQLAQFCVHVRRPGVVALQNVHNPGNWLAVRQGQTVGTGRGGQYCDFEVKEIEGQFVCLESVMHPGQHVGVLPDGSVKPPHQTGKGLHGRFTVSVHTYSGLGIQSMFSQGNVVILTSNATGKSLRINEAGDVEGLGGRRELAQFRVHLRRPGVVALQNIFRPEKWLAIFQGQTIGSGRGGEFCEFKLVIIEGQFVCLESVKAPGQFVGILPDGCVKPPGNTKTGLHGRFIPSFPN